MKDIIICIDDGHGMETIGKRTPILDDGSFMPENEFNRTVVKYLDIELQRCGFKTLLVAPTNDDTALLARINLANNTIKNKYNKPADFYLSVHANAFKGIWGEHGGIETYVYTGTNAETIKMGEIIHKHLIEGTPLRDRGLKKSDFYVLKNTSMPAVLVECGFMDNKEEALLLMSDKYRRECATELAQAICEIYKVEYVKEEVKEEVKVEYKIEIQKIKMRNGNYEFELDGFVIEGKAYTSIRDTLTTYGYKVDYDEKTKTIITSGK